MTDETQAPPESTDPIPNEKLAHNRWYLGVRASTIRDGTPVMTAAMWMAHNGLFATLSIGGQSLQVDLMPSGWSAEHDEAFAEATDAFIPMVSVQDSYRLENVQLPDMEALDDPGFVIPNAPRAIQ